MSAGWAYFDTSALLKRYVREEGSTRARELMRRHRILSCAIAPVEAFSALFRRKADGDLGERSYAAIIARMRADRAHWELVELGEAVLGRAEDVISQTGVRTLDALHVASALVFQEWSGLRVPFVTADDRQREAALRMGLRAIEIAPA